MPLNVLQIINEVQRKLRLPESTTLDTHGNLILSFINETQRSIMKDAALWDALKIYGNFDTVASTDIYTVSITPSGDLSKIMNMQIGNYNPLEKMDSGKFLEYKREIGTQEERPLAYRMYSRVNNVVKVQLCPTPDDVYTVDVEAIKKPPRLSNTSETPLLDEDVIIDGAYLLSKIEQGNADPLEFEEFVNNFGATVVTEGSSNLTEVEPC